MKRRQAKVILTDGIVVFKRNLTFKKSAYYKVELPNGISSTFLTFPEVISIIKSYRNA